MRQCALVVQQLFMLVMFDHRASSPSPSPSPSFQHLSPQTVLTASLAFDIIDRIRCFHSHSHQHPQPLSNPFHRNSGGTLGIEPPEWVKTQIVATLIEPPGLWFLFNMACMLVLCSAVAAGAPHALIGVFVVPCAPFGVFVVPCAPFGVFVVPCAPFGVFVVPCGTSSNPVRSCHFHAPQHRWTAPSAVRAKLYISSFGR
jgi:hypothetical protein